MLQIITNTDDGSFITLTPQEQETDEIIILEGLRDVQTVAGALYKYIEWVSVCVCVSEREREGGGG